MPKAIIFDIDGTLTVSKSLLSRDMGVLLAQLFEKAPVAIMSGGSYAQFQRQLLNSMPEEVNYANLYLFPTSSAQCYIWKDAKWQMLYENQFTQEEKTLVLNALSEALHETGLDQKPPRLWGDQIEDRGSQITWSALGQQAPVEEKEKWDHDRAKRLPLQSAILAKISGFSVGVNATSSIDITRKGITKAYGVRQFSKIIDTPISDMVYIGDALFHGGNDEIVKETGIPTKQADGPSDTASIIKTFL